MCLREAGAEGAGLFRWPVWVGPGAVGWQRWLAFEQSRPEGSMERLIAGHKRFLKEVFPQRRSHFHLLAEGQAPEWLFITCSDSRVVPDMVLGTEPGDLFITRNAGNVVPLTAQDVDGCTATIEYAVKVLKVKDAILCGHSDCGALKAALDHSALEGLPKAAERPLRRVLALDPGRAFARMALATALAAQAEDLPRGARKEAVRMLEEARGPGFSPTVLSRVEPGGAGLG